MNCCCSTTHTHPDLRHLAPAQLNSPTSQPDSVNTAFAFTAVQSSEQRTQVIKDYGGAPVRLGITLLSYDKTWEPAAAADTPASITFFQLPPSGRVH